MDGAAGGGVSVGRNVRPGVEEEEWLEEKPAGALGGLGWGRVCRWLHTNTTRTDTIDATDHRRS